MHGALIGAAWVWRRAQPPEPRVMEITFLDLGDAPVESAPELPPAEPAAPQAPAPPTPAPQAPVAAPVAREPAPVAEALPEVGEPLPSDEAGTVAERAPAPPAAAPSPPTSFRAFQQANPSRYPVLNPAEVAAGSTGGGSRQGVDRCEPPPRRRFEVVYLLFDSSGSMSHTSGPNALTCAHQIAKSAIDAGASVVVANFARGTTISGPTRSMLDVEVALRATSDRTATILPARELQPYIDRAPDADAELVIVSDGVFGDDRATLPWYRYFLELNPDNRGRMYTIDGAGSRESVAAMRSLGFDVFMYDPLRGRAAP